jgi:hypothetical protein
MSASKNDNQTKPSKDAMRVGSQIEIRGVGKKKKLTPPRPNRLRDGS